MTAEFGYQEEEEELSFDDYEFGLIDNLKKAIVGGMAKTRQFLSKLSKAAKATLQSAGKKAMDALKKTKASLTRSKQRLSKLKARVARTPKLKAKYNALVKNQGVLGKGYTAQAAKAAKAQKTQKAGFIAPLLIPLAIGIAAGLGVEGIKIVMNLFKKSAEHEARISALEEQIAEAEAEAEAEEPEEEEYYEEEDEVEDE